jgi:probable blue pigment (indigoidine) exporter
VVAWRSWLSPLRVATAAALVGGAGNVAFSWHDGSQIGLALLRFGFGASAAAIYLLAVRPSRPSLRPVKRVWLLMHVSGGCGAGAITLMIVAARHTSVLLLTLLGLVAPALLAVAGRVLRFPSGSWWQAGWAAVAVSVAAVASVVGGVSGESEVFGVVLAAVATLLGLVSAVSSVFAASVRHPAEVLVSIGVWGVVISLAAVAAGVPLVVTRSSVAASLFLALLPGGAATAALIWAQARTAPYLVSAAGSASLLSAAALGWLLLGQRPSLVTAGAAVVVAAAVTLMQRERAVGGGAGSPAALAPR